MCGRFTLRSRSEDIARLFDLDEVPKLAPRYNIAPTQSVPAVRLRPGGDERELVQLHWGLIPFWADDPKIGNRMINARAETVAKKPAYRAAFRRRRCLVVADGFYDWQKTNGTKRPWFIHREDDRPFAFAGLWESWKESGSENVVESCTIIVTDANELLAPIHDRMPVILPEERYDLWLDPEIEETEPLTSLLQPCSDDELEAYPVGTTVNNPQNDSAECIEPAE